MKFKLFALAALACVAFSDAAKAGLQVRVGNGQGVRVNAGFNGGAGFNNLNRPFYFPTNFNRFANFNRGYNYNQQAVFLVPSAGYNSFGSSYNSFGSSYGASSYVQPSQTILIREVPVYVQAQQQTYVQPQAAAEVYCPPTEQALLSVPQVSSSVQVYQSAPTGYLQIPNYQPGAIFVPGRGWHHHPGGGHHPPPVPTPVPVPTPGGAVRGR